MKRSVPNNLFQEGILLSDGYNVFDMPRYFNKESSTGFLVALHACTKIGAIMIPSIIFDVAEDLEYKLNFSKAKMVISTIPLIDANLLLINKVKEENKKTIIAVISHQIDDAVRLYDEGATYVLMPHFLGSKHFSTMIETNKLDMNKFLEEKIAHVEHLKYRKQLGHKHPAHKDK